MREMSSAGFEAKEGVLEPREDWLALVGAHGDAPARPGPLLAQFGFDAVEVLELAHQPCAGARTLFEGVVEFPAYVRPASRPG